jgi:hypothetical protein
MMSLSCSCGFDYDCDYGDWRYDADSSTDFEPLSTNRAKRCKSCNCLIKVGELCLSHTRSRYAYNEIEARIVGSDPEDGDQPEIKMAPHYQCERCGEIWLNLFYIGYECLSPSENMEEALKEYWERTGFKKAAS